MGIKKKKKEKMRRDINKEEEEEEGQGRKRRKRREMTLVKLNESEKVGTYFCFVCYITDPKNLQETSLEKFLPVCIVNLAFIL